MKGSRRRGEGFMDGMEVYMLEHMRGVRGGTHVDGGLVEPSDGR